MHAATRDLRTTARTVATRREIPFKPFIQKRIWKFSICLGRFALVFAKAMPSTGSHHDPACPGCDCVLPDDGGCGRKRRTRRHPADISAARTSDQDPEN